MDTSTVKSITTKKNGMRMTEREKEAKAHPSLFGLSFSSA
jgi:hypothetical protein